jgi:hypothetical protein
MIQPGGALVRFPPGRLKGDIMIKLIVSLKGFSLCLTVGRKR